MVTPRELDEEKAINNWCQNISLGCVAPLVENEAQVGSESSHPDTLLGESNNTNNLPSPHSPSSSPEEPPQLVLPPPPVFPLPSPPVEVDCRVSKGQDCVSPPEGTSAPSVSHQALVQSVTKVFGAWIVLWQGSPAYQHVSRLANRIIVA